MTPETIAAIQRHYDHARAKHPYFCDKLISDSLRVDAKTALRRAWLFLKEDIEIHNVDAISICDVEIAEFCAAYEQGDTAAAREKILDAIAVLLRTIDVLDGTQPLGSPKTESENHHE